MRIESLLLVVLLAGCSEDEPSNPPVTDTGPADTSSVTDTGARDTAVSETSETSVDAPADTESDAPDTFNACTEVGMLCNTTQPCPGSLRCYGNPTNGFCAPDMPECGGFAMTMCSGGRTCLRAAGSLGYCATEGEKTCLCEKKDAGYTLDGCD